MAEIKFRDLTVDNAFDFCAVLDAIGVESVVGAFDKNEIYQLQKSGKDNRGVGIAIALKIVGIVIKNIGKARTEIYGFFANCMDWDNGSKVTPDDLKSMKIGQFTKLIKEFAKKDDLADFFKEVAEFAGMEPGGSQN